MVTDSRRVQRFDAYVTYTATRTVDGADERAAIGCLLRSRAERVKQCFLGETAVREQPIMLYN